MDAGSGRGWHNWGHVAIDLEGIGQKWFDGGGLISIDVWRRLGHEYRYTTIVGSLLACRRNRDYAPRLDVYPVVEMRVRHGVWGLWDEHSRRPSDLRASQPT